jgi:hypothetical protein
MKSKLGILAALLLPVAVVLGSTQVAAAASRSEVRMAIEQMIATECGPSRCNVNGVNNELFSVIAADNRTNAEGSARMDVLSFNSMSVSNITGTGASCNDCKAVAANFLAVLLPSSVDDVTSIENRLFNAQLSCTNCANIAYGHVVVVATNELNPRLTSRARQALRSIENRATRLDRNMPVDQLMARLDGLRDEFTDVVANGTDRPPRWHRSKSKGRGCDDRGSDVRRDHDSGRRERRR